MPLDEGQCAEAYRLIAAWRADPAVAPVCPVCAAPGLTVIDRSARPYAEWYALACAGCGLDETLHIPLAPPSSSNWD